ncbi:hypothetical protein HHK36_005248 [Tetracentron sinense]|uniref:Uncharacterized protein n=1 Tax=Tetracentron sinense TaxID=13715 RepID=A0A835DQJ6_TETSI|nr:hypothetical protein HHK36_005248 [Tetracentron sinense]
MAWEKEHLDLILVPSGLFIMIGYHIILLYRCLKHPHTTVIGFENHHKKAWVERMMQVNTKDTGLALQVIGGNTSASTFLASVSLTLSSLIGAWIGSSTNNSLLSELVYGDTSASTIIIKYITLVSFFLLAFSCFIQAARYFVHANFLISTPNTDIPVKYVQSAVIRGSMFWSLGLRSLYFATCLLLWILGPIPMFVSSVIMVVLLHFFDTNSTPLHQYQKHSNHDFVKKIGEEINAVARVIEHRGGQHGSPSSTTDTQTMVAITNQNVVLENTQEMKPLAFTDPLSVPTATA